MSLGRKKFNNVKEKLNKKRLESILFNIDSIYTVIVFIITIIGFGIWIGNLHNKVYSNEKQIEHINTRLDNYIDNLNGKIANGAEKCKLKLDTSVSVGLINEEISEKARTSYGQEYKQKEKICEINSSSNLWHKIGGIPKLGAFIEINSEITRLSTWAMVVGSFNGSDNQNRLILITQVVADDLDFKKEMGIITGCISIIPDEVALKDKEKLKLKKDIYKLSSN